MPVANASYGDLTYEAKLPHYLTQNLLARSLHPQCYEHNPGFLRFREQSSLPFAPLPQFKNGSIHTAVTARASRVGSSC